MKKFLLSSTLAILLGRLAFPVPNLQDKSTVYANSQRTMNEAGPNGYEISWKRLSLGRLNENKEGDSSGSNDGAFLMYVGIAAAVVGMVFLGTSYSDIALVDTTKYRKPGIILTSVGLGLIVIGFVIRKSSSDKDYKLIFSYDPFAGRGSGGLKINF